MQISTSRQAQVCELHLQMLIGIDIEVRRQIRPFLSAGIQPDIILLEAEGTTGVLYAVTLPNGQLHSRGVADGLVSQDQLQMEVCGQLPTGHVDV